MARQRGAKKVARYVEKVRIVYGHDEPDAMRSTMAIMARRIQELTLHPIQAPTQPGPNIRKRPGQCQRPIGLKRSCR